MKGKPAVTDQRTHFGGVFPKWAECLGGPAVEFIEIFGQPVGQRAAQTRSGFLGRIQFRGVGRQADEADVGRHTLGAIGRVKAGTVPKHHNMCAASISRDERW